jgi:hypothetical protein
MEREGFKVMGHSGKPITDSEKLSKRNSTVALGKRDAMGKRA